MGATVDFGIDLGTTNSAIARFDGDKPRLLPGEGGDVLLPSAVWLGADGEPVVGAAARARFDSDAANTALEFKRGMGTAEARRFPASNRSMKPEEMSALVLEALLARVPGERPVAAVVTVPAMFQLPQCDATQRAAALAKLAFAPLLQEPIAAAIAHGGTGELREGYWLVYDLGGGTFDVSLVRSKEGRLQVLDHDGDNHLGGRDLDRAVIRAATERARTDGKWPDFARTDPRHAALTALVKAEAERVRVALSNEEQARFTLRGAEVDFGFDIDRGELEALAAPLLKRTTRLACAVLQRNRVKGSDLQAVVLVGGPTRMPLVARAIREDVGQEARHVIDPMHVVAAGAALFASTQRVPIDVRQRAPLAADAAMLDLAYESMTTNPSPLFAGRVVKSATQPTSIRLTRGDGGFASDWVKIDAKGGFALRTPLAQNATNVFKIELRAADGSALVADPKEARLMHGFSVSKPPLSQSVGVVLADGNVAWYVKKGAALPTRKQMTHTTTVELRRGQSGDAIKVPIAQGESARGDRNKIIGVLHIRANALARDLQRGSEVQVTLTVDESSRATARAYVPLLDQWFDDVMRFELESKDAAVVKKELAEQKSRLEELSALASELEEEGEDLDERVRDIEQLIEEGDGDGVDTADQLLRSLGARLDVAALRDRGATLDARFKEEAGYASELLREHARPGEAAELASLRTEYGLARQNGDLDLCEQKCDDTQAFVFRILLRLPAFWQGRVKWQLERCRELGVDVGAVGQRARAAVQGTDIHQLVEVSFELAKLLPAADAQGGTAALTSHIR